MEVKDEVELANIAKVAVKYLDEVMDDVQHDQLVVFLLNARNEVQRCIPETMRMYAQLDERPESQNNGFVILDVGGKRCHECIIKKYEVE